MSEANVGEARSAEPSLVLLLKFLPGADPLHFLKSIRSRLINYEKVFAFYSDDSCYTSINELNEILQIGKITNDTTKMGKMRDSYAVHLFTFENVAKLIQNKCFASACVLFPYACIVSVLFSTRLSIGFRIFFIELTFYFFVKLLEEFPKLDKNGIHQKGTESVTISKEHYLKRIINSLVIFGIALIFGDERLRIDALGTHLVENTIGIARQTSFDPRWQRILATYCIAEERKELAKKLGITIHVQNRLNDGGVKIENDPKKEPEHNEIEKPDDWECNSIIQLFRCMCNPDCNKALNDEIDKFAQQLFDISKFVDL